MGCFAPAEKTFQPHAVCVPYPAQGHINPMLKLAKLLHTQGFYITFVLTDFNYRRLVRSNGQESVDGLPDFRFEAIPDGLPPSDDDATQDVPSLCESTMKNCLAPFSRLLAKLNDRASSDPVAPNGGCLPPFCGGRASGPTYACNPPVSCVVSDGVMTFTLDAARELGVPEVLLWTTSACGYLAYLYTRELMERGIVPLQDEAQRRNGYLDAEVDWLSGLARGTRLRDLPSFMLTSDPDDIMFNFVLHETRRASMASGIIINTFDALEPPALDALQKILPPLYAVGPLSVHTISSIPKSSPVAGVSTSLWKEDSDCLRWLDGREPDSVVYVNFGSITVMSNEQLVEFAWGLANSGYDFLWVIRPDLVKGETAVLPPEFTEETKDRGLMATWCGQEEVLMHPAVGVFLTHCGWNSTIESIGGGVPMICWPFFAEQQTNCRYSCTEWGVGMEINTDVKREDVEGMIREMMEGEKGKDMRRKAVEWKESAAKACSPGGSSAENLKKMISGVLLQ